MNTNNFADSLLSGVLGNVKHAENSQSVSEMLDRFNLNWTVSKQPLILPDGTGTSFYGVIRDDRKICFNTCKDSYLPFQNSELAEMLIRLSEKTGYTIHKGGMFNDGAKVYLQLDSPNKITGIGQNKTTVNGFLTGINSHDGSTSLKWGETNVTICCKNTFMAALRAVKNAARHTQGIHDKVEQAIREINGVVEAEKSLFSQFIKLSEVPVTEKSIRETVKLITDVDTSLTRSELEKNYTTYSINRSKELLTAISKEMNQKGKTMWGLFSGVTNYTSHTMPVPKRDNARLESTYAGSGYKINNDSFNLIAELAGI
jgi:phage/plasmid-like protein (TIGR03299 family)